MQTYLQFMSFLSDSSKLTFKTIFPFQMNSTTRFLALIGTCVSLHALFSLFFLLEFRALDWILSIPWFLLNLAAQILCLLVFHQFGNKSIFKTKDAFFFLYNSISALCFVRFTNWSSRRCQLAGKCNWMALLNYFFPN